MSLWNKIVSSALMVWGSIFGAAGTPATMNPTAFVPQLPLVQDIAVDESGAGPALMGQSPDANSVGPNEISADEYEAKFASASLKKAEVPQAVQYSARDTNVYEDAYVSFTIPEGHEVQVNTSTNFAATTSTFSMPFDTHIVVDKPELVSTSPGMPKKELNLITIDIRANPDALSLREWVHVHANIAEDSEITEYQFAGQTGVRWVPPAGAHRGEAVALSAFGYIVQVMHAYETEEEMEIFNELLSTFALKGK